MTYLNEATIGVLFPDIIPGEADEILSIHKINLKEMTINVLNGSCLSGMHDSNNIDLLIFMKPLFEQWRKSGLSYHQMSRCAEQGRERVVYEDVA